MRYFSHATNACLTSHIRRDGVYPGSTSRRVVRQIEAGRSSQRLRGWRGVTHPARFQGPQGFYEAARGI